MLPASTKIWLNPFVSKTVKELYDAHYNRDLLVTQDLTTYSCQPGFIILKLSQDHLKNADLCKITYNNKKNSLICSRSCLQLVNHVMTVEMTYQCIQIQLKGLKQDYAVDFIEPIQPSPDEEYYQIIERPSAYKSPSFYLFVADEPICIRI